MSFVGSVTGGASGEAVGSVMGGALDEAIWAERSLQAASTVR